LRRLVGITASALMLGLLALDVVLLLLSRGNGVEADRARRG
jgi:hypothetical protein